MDSRARGYKSGSNSISEIRSRHNGVTIELRKSKKEDQMNKRRNIDINATSPIKEPNSPISDDKAPMYASMADVVKDMKGTDPTTVFRATQAARKILSQERNPPIDTLIDFGIVPICIKFLDSADPELQFEAAWALTNIASGTSNQTGVVAKAGAIPKFVNLLKSENTNVAEQSVWALGNIAGDGPHARDEVLRYDADEALVGLLSKKQPISFMRNIVWLMSNLCRNKNPGPPVHKIQRMLPSLATFLCHHDPAILTDAAWAISYVTDDDGDRIQAVIEAGCVPSLINLLGHTENSIIVPALRSIGNIVTGSDIQTDIVLSAGVLPKLKGLLKNPKNNIVKEAAWTLSNITAGNADQIQRIMEADLFTDICEVLQHGESRSQKEAAWIITNITSSGNSQQIFSLVDQGILKPYCDLLGSTDARCIVVVLQGMKNLFAMASKVGVLEKFSVLFEEIGGVDRIDKLQTHQNEEIYKYVAEMIDLYFPVNDEAENLAPKNDGDTLQFNTNNANGNNFNF